LPSEETTPPVTNIYFGAIRIARAVTRFTTPDFLPLRRGRVVLPTSQPAVGLTYKQLWATQDILSIPTLCAVASKISIAAQLFHKNRVPSIRTALLSDSAGSTAYVQLLLPTHNCGTETNCAKPPSKLESIEFFTCPSAPRSGPGSLSECPLNGPRTG
jgi:hypothetical protein